MLSRISGLRGKNAALEIGFARIFIITNEMGIFGGRSLFAKAIFQAFGASQACFKVAGGILACNVPLKVKWQEIRDRMAAAYAHRIKLKT